MLHCEKKRLLQAVGSINNLYLALGLSFLMKSITVLAGNISKSLNFQA